MENDSQRTENTFRSSHIKDLGTINIEIHRQEVLGKSENTGSAADKTLGGASAFTEKQLKGKSVTHGIAYVWLFTCSSA